MATERILSDRLNEICDWNWNEFCLARDSENISYTDKILFELINLCCYGRPKVYLVKEAINRLSGLPEETIIIKLPKQRVLYPYAKTKEASVKTPESTKPEVVAGEPSIEQPTTRLRDMLKSLIKMPSENGKMILEYRDKAEGGALDNKYAPKVGAVFCANMLESASNGNGLMLFELFDQIDGKMAQVINIGGSKDNVYYLTDYSDVAPADAIKNKDGIYFSEREMLVRGQNDNIEGGM